MRTTSQAENAPSSALIARASARLRTALALHESGVALKRAQLRRLHPGESERRLAERLAEWLRTRPGATNGDADGVLKSLAVG